MSGGKTSQKQQTVSLPPEITEAAKQNLALAHQVGTLPYAPNFGLRYAAFTPQQEAAFHSTQGAADAFGLPSVSYGGPHTGMGLPAPQTVGGFSGYSTKDLYNHAVNQLPPATRAMYDAFFRNPRTGSMPTDGPGATPATPSKPQMPIIGGGANPFQVIDTPLGKMTVQSWLYLHDPNRGASPAH